MGSSVLLVLLAPFFAVYLFFVGIVTEIQGPPQAEIVLPYDESQGLVWEYVDQEDYYINLVEVKVEDDKQIFVFERETITSEFFSEVILGFTEERTTGEVIDLVFEDQNGNKETYYHDPNESDLVLYAESDCRVIEYTVTALNPDEDHYWSINTEGGNNVLRQPVGDDDETFTIVVMPYELEDIRNGEIVHINFINYLNGAGTERATVQFGLNESDQLEVVYENIYEYYR